MGNLCLGIALAGLLLVVCGAVIWVIRRRRALRQPFDTQMTYLAQMAVLSGKAEYKVTLDYSESSVAEVDRILGQLHEWFVAGDLDERTMEKLALRWGSYLGEVAKRIKPGRWERDSPVGHDSLPLVFGPEQMCFPVAWCYKRMENGDEDSIMVKFDVFLRRMDEIMEEADGHNGVAEPDADK